MTGEAQTKGYLINSQTQFRQMLEPVMMAFNIDAVEREGKIYFIDRTLEPVLIEPYTTDRVTSLATCWKLTRKDGTVKGFTDHDKNLFVDGVTYEAATGFTPTAISSSSNLAVDNLDVEGALTSDSITADDLNAGLYDFAEIEIFIINYKTLTGKIVMRRGHIGQVETGDNDFRAEVRGLMQAYQQTGGSVYQRTCRAKFCDAKCKINPADYTMTGTITEVVSNAEFVSDLAQSDAYYDYGLITFTSGLNQGLQCEIKQFDENVFKLFLPIPNDIQLGDTFTVLAGCDGNLSTCRDRYENTVNFRGEPHVPGNDKLMAYPTR